MGETKAHVHAERDNVAVALDNLKAAGTVAVRRGKVEIDIVMKDDVPFGHKFALEAIEADGDVTKYGGFIGKATRPIAVGEHVHVHNISGVKYT